MRDELKGPLTIAEIHDLTDFAITEENPRIAALILKAASQSVQMLKEFANGYQVRGELHELSDNAARLIHDKLQQVVLLPLCSECRKLVNHALGLE